LQAVQEKRHQKQVPGGLRLHQYANLYFHARNPMMYSRKNQADILCVLRVGLDILSVSGVVLADCNAGSDYVRFLSPAQWSLLAFDDIYARVWTHPGNPPRYFHRDSTCLSRSIPTCSFARISRACHVQSPDRRSLRQPCTDTG
jgi:hypothetical protein